MKGGMFDFSDSSAHPRAGPKRELKIWGLSAKILLPLGVLLWIFNDAYLQPRYAQHRKAAHQIEEYVRSRVYLDQAEVAELPGALHIDNSSWFTDDAVCAWYGLPDRDTCWKTAVDGDYIDGLSSKTVSFSFVYDQTTGRLGSSDEVTRKFWRIKDELDTQYDQLLKRRAR